MFIVGHRVIAQTEPELGLGLVIEVQGRRLEVLFPGGGVVRRYVAGSAPLVRFLLKPGQKAVSKEGERFVVVSVVEENGVILYQGEEESLWEYELHHQIEDLGALHQFLHGNWSHPRTYGLRKRGWALRGRTSPGTKGLMGARVWLLPHQLHVAKEVAGRALPRVLLADEVGLGKTIEAGLVFSTLRSLDRAGRVLIVVPDALKHQWLAEMYRRFNELFTVLDEDRSVQEEESMDTSPFLSSQRIICSMDFLLENLNRLEQAASSPWDLLIIDEAHHLGWNEKEPSLEWEAARALSKAARGLLLLTATPKQGGLETQFGLLNLVDPERFSSFKTFKKEADQIRETATLVRQLNDGDAKALAALKKRFPQDPEIGEAADRESLIRLLVDRHGTGRVLIRNRRERLKGFPKRELHAVKLAVHEASRKSLKAIDPETITPKKLFSLATGETAPNKKDDPRSQWLLEFLEKTKEKVLLICSSPNRVKELDAFLLEHAGIRRALFHEEMEIVERDRQAAWFAQPDGAQVLLCSEIGGEGRNFQFAHNLVLYDFPANPDLLEQRIGRLDRIGQRDTVHIYVPWLEDTPEEVLFRWYNEGLNSLEQVWTGGAPILESLKEEILECCRAYLPKSKKFKTRAKLLDKLLERTQKEAKRLYKEQQESVDLLVDLNSFNEAKGSSIAEEIRTSESNPDLQEFMEAVFDHYGVQSEKLDEDGTYKLQVNSQTFVDNFPELSPDQDKLVTFRRSRALDREDLTLLTEDHPMVDGALGLLLDRNEGRASVCCWPKSPHSDRGVLLQLLYLLEATAPKSLELERYLPPTSLEVIVDAQGEILPVETVGLKGATLKPVPENFIKMQLGNLEKVLPPLVEKAAAELEDKASELVEQAITAASRVLAEEQSRLEYLARVNASVSAIEVNEHLKKTAATLETLADATPRLDAVRLILLQDVN